MTGRGERWLITYTIPDPDGGKGKRVLKRGFPTKKAASTYLRGQLANADRGEWVDPSREQLAAYLEKWIKGQRLRPSTLASYRKNIRLHIAPQLGSIPLRRLTGTQINAWLRDLEKSGRADGTGGLSARTTRYVYTILRSALTDAVRDGMLAANPTDRATPPSAAEAKPPEMHCWTAAQLRAFLGWSTERGDELGIAWQLLAATGMRRGEALALRWRDIDLEAGRVAVRRSVGVVKTKGAGSRSWRGRPRVGTRGSSAGWTAAICTLSGSLARSPSGSLSAGGLSAPTPYRRAHSTICVTPTRACSWPTVFRSRSSLSGSGTQTSPSPSASIST